MNATLLATSTHRPSTCNRPSLELTRRADQLLRTEIGFISNGEFNLSGLQPTAEGEIDLDTTESKVDPPADLPGHLARLCETPLLTRELERELFRQMNYRKFRANALRSRLNADRPDADLIERIEEDLDQARRLRDRIVQANMRLAISVVKKFVSPSQSFDDLLSDGIDSLMQAAEKFDYGRGFRFSTYAYRAIAHNAYRAIASRQRDQARFVNGIDETLDECPTADESSSLDEHAWERLRSALATMIDKLDRRERFIIRGRYALGWHRKVKTFQALADKLGISKERVRQLENRAVAKLRLFATEMQIERFAEPA